MEKLKFKVGDKVYCSYHNNTGEVVAIENRSDCIAVQFKHHGKTIFKYYADGRYYHSGIIRLRLLTPLEELL